LKNIVTPTWAIQHTLNRKLKEPHVTLNKAFYLGENEAT